jgi:hypothetical protein
VWSPGSPLVNGGQRPRPKRADSPIVGQLAGVDRAIRLGGCPLIRRDGPILLADCPTKRRGARSTALTKPAGIAKSAQNTAGFRVDVRAGERGRVQVIGWRYAGERDRSQRVLAGSPCSCVNLLGRLRPGRDCAGCGGVGAEGAVDDVEDAAFEGAEGFGLGGDGARALVSSMPSITMVVSPPVARVTNRSAGHGQSRRRHAPVKPRRPVLRVREAAQGTEPKRQEARSVSVGCAAAGPGQRKETPDSGRWCAEPEIRCIVLDLPADLARPG